MDGIPQDQIGGSRSVWRTSNPHSNVQSQPSDFHAAPHAPRVEGPGLPDTVVAARAERYTAAGNALRYAQAHPPADSVLEQVKHANDIFRVSITRSEGSPCFVDPRNGTVYDLQLSSDRTHYLMGAILTAGTAFSTTHAASSESSALPTDHPIDLGDPVRPRGGVYAGIGAAASEHSAVAAVHWSSSRGRGPLAVSRQSSVAGPNAASRGRRMVDSSTALPRASTGHSLRLSPPVVAQPLPEKIRIAASTTMRIGQYIQENMRTCVKVLDRKESQRTGTNTYHATEKSIAELFAEYINSASHERELILVKHSCSGTKVQVEAALADIQDQYMAALKSAKTPEDKMRAAIVECLSSIRTHPRTDGNARNYVLLRFIRRMIEQGQEFAILPNPKIVEGSSWDEVYDMTIEAQSRNKNEWQQASSHTSAAR